MHRAHALGLTAAAFPSSRAPLRRDAWRRAIAGRTVRDDCAAAHHHDAVREQHGFHHVVSDHHGGEPHRVVKVAHLRAERIARDRIERAERLVHQQDRGLRGERARDADALLLAHRERAQAGACRTLARKRDEIDELVDARRDSAPSSTQEDAA